MTLKETLARVVMQEDLNFLLTNRIPRRLATKLVGRLSKIEQPLVARGSIALWRLFSDVDLSDAAEARYPSMHACFTRALRPGARSFDSDPAVLASPSDAILGAHGRIEGDQVHQIKGFPYSLAELLGDAALAARYAGGTYATLRLTAGMYHRFHAPADLTVREVRYISGDCWNVNPIALKRVERLFCRNERAVIRAALDDGTEILLVPVAAILVAGIRLTFLDTPALLREGGERSVALSARLSRGEEMGWFEHGSTIVVLTPAGLKVAEDLATGDRIRAGRRLLMRA